MADLTIEDEGASVLECRINGKDYAIGLAAAADAIELIDRRHFADPWSCRSCWKEFVPSSDDLLSRAERVSATGDGWVPARDEIPCAHCGSREVAPAQSFLDDVSELLHSRWGVPRLSRAGAWKFYEKIAATLGDVKKKSIASRGSRSGSEESTVVAGTN